MHAVAEAQLNSFSAKVQEDPEAKFKVKVSRLQSVTTIVEKPAVTKFVESDVYFRLSVSEEGNIEGQQIQL